MTRSDTLNLVGEDFRDQDGSWSRALSTLGRLVHPDITVTDPPEDAAVDWDVPVPMRGRDPVASQRVPSRRR